MPFQKPSKQDCIEAVGLYLVTFFLSMSLFFYFVFERNNPMSYENMPLAWSWSATSRNTATGDAMLGLITTTILMVGFWVPIKFFYEAGLLAEVLFVFFGGYAVYVFSYAQVGTIDRVWRARLFKIIFFIFIFFELIYGYSLFLRTRGIPSMFQISNPQAFMIDLRSNVTSV